MSAKRKDMKMRLKVKIYEKKGIFSCRFGVEKSIIEWSCLFLSAIYVTLAINYILVGDLEFQVTVVENL